MRYRGSNPLGGFSMRLRKVSTPMTFQFDFRFIKSATMMAFFSLGISGFLALPVLAGNGARCMVTRDGKRVPLVKSATEYGVTLKKVALAKGCATRLKIGGLGVLSDIDGKTNAITKLLTVPSTSSKQRMLILQDAAVEDVRHVYYFKDGKVPFISTGQLMVRVNPGLSAVALGQLWDDYSVDVVKENAAGLKHVYLVKPRYGVTDEVLRAEVLAVDKRTVWAQPDFKTPLQQHQASITPDDPFFSKQWHLENPGTEFGLADADIDATAAWAVTLGDGVRLGMFDDSCDIQHEDLKDNYVGVGDDITIQGNAPGFDDPSPKSLGDNHGTAVMGLAVASANTMGVRGVAPEAHFTASRGLGSVTTFEQIASAYTFARQQNVDVHINSWGFDSALTALPAPIEDAIDTAFNEGRDVDGTGPNRPRGMVVVFSAGNGVFGVGRELEAGQFIATLPTVIGVGASNVFDQVTTYSDFGPEIDVIAPGGDFNGLITTTDNDDLAGYVDPGFNDGGFDSFSGTLDIDPTGLYHGFFSGTSASCPITAGVAALILSVNPNLTATDVRVILEHTADKVNSTDAAYHGITNRSLRYGYGRINAGLAVKAAQDSLVNSNRSWPERVGDVRISGSQLLWRQNGDRLEFRVLEEIASSVDDTAVILPELRTTDEFLILSSDEPFDFVPVDGECYSRLQLGCGDSNSTPLVPLPTGVVVHSDANQSGVGCSFSCLAEGTAACEANSIHCMNFDASSSKKYFAIYARSKIGRYSFGVAVDSDGVVTDAAFIPGTGGSTSTNPVDLGPQISIRVSPRLGLSPLTVRFQGNGISEFPINNDKTSWDFDIDDDVAVDTSSRIATHTYVVAAGKTKTFTAKLTMFDVNDNIGFAQTTITVTGPDAAEANRGTADAGEISVSLPGATGSDVDTGVSPFSVELSVNTSGLPGTLQSVRWDLGDGTTADSLFVTHTYINETTRELRLPITVRITTVTSGSTILTTSISRTITVLPGAGINDGPGEIPILDGAGASGAGGAGTPCGVVSMLPLFVMVFSLAGYRRLWS